MKAPRPSSVWQQEASEAAPPQGHRQPPLVKRRRRPSAAVTSTCSDARRSPACGPCAVPAPFACRVARTVFCAGAGARVRVRGGNACKASKRARVRALWIARAFVWRHRLCTCLSPPLWSPRRAADSDSGAALGCMLTMVSINRIDSCNTRRVNLAVCLLPEA